jgi:glutamate N-acetyltransferase/amino-acid N-acetyltransferase
MPALSPLAPERFPVLPPVGGVRLATFAAGLRYTRRADLMLAVVEPGTAVAGTLTRSLCPSAPVEWCRRLLPSGAGRAVVANAGNANAFTGSAGDTAAEMTAHTVGEALGIGADEVYLASTGVIGENLPSAALAAALPLLVGELADSSAATWEAAANAIRTTDTFAKGSAATIAGSDAVVVGIAKGSGMIAPDMATMLAFVFTDAQVGPSALQAATSAAVEGSFNRITVDSDTSTSDTALVFATGTAGAVQPDAFQEALDAVMLDLAHQIVRDGEGATKFVEVTVHGAADDAAAKAIALSIGNSPLVKTALAASDANWGRIVAAVGKAGQAANRDALKIWIGDELTADHGTRADGYSEARATEHLRQDEVRLVVDVGVGDGSATIWTCDLTHAYIDINAGYRS